MRVLLVVEADIATTELVEQVLQCCAPYGVTYRKKYLAAFIPDDLECDEVPMFVRTGDPRSDYWPTLLQESGWPYVYYIDDNFWELQGSSALAQYYQDAGVRRALQYFVSGAAVVLTNSSVLAGYLERFSGRVRCVPAFFDFSLIRGVRCLQHQEARIGFAGSSTRVNDLELIKPAIAQVLHQFPNAVFEFVGVWPSGVQEGPRVRFFREFGSYAEFIKFQASRGWLIGLAPLRLNEANRSKTNNKFREYGACGIAGIYSDIDPYAEVVNHVTGLVVQESASAWTDAIYALLTAPDVAAKIGENAREVVRARYSVDAIAADWYHHLDLLAWKPGEPKRSISSRARAKVLARKVVGRVRSAHLLVKLAYRDGGVREVARKTRRRLYRLMGK